MNDSKKYIFSGVVISNLIMFFVGSFIVPWMWGVVELNHQIALVLMLIIVFVTLCSAVASYFWSYTGIPLRNLRWLAVANLIWVWVFMLFHPAIGLKTTYSFFNEATLTETVIVDDLLYNFFSKAILLIVILCSLLGNWFGRRVFYE